MKSRRSSDAGLDAHAGVVLPRGGERAARQQLGGVDLRGDLGDRDLHRHVLGDGELRVGEVALARPLHEVRIAAAREAERRAEQRIGVHRDERRAVDRVGVELRAGRVRVAQRRERDAAMLGHEHVVEPDGVRAACRAGRRSTRCRACFTSDDRHQEQPHVRMVLALAEHQAADHDPLRVANAAAPRPFAVEAVAAGRDLGLAGRRGRGGDAGVRVAAPHVVLRLLGEMRQDAGVVAEVVEAPGRRAAGRAAELDRDVEGDLVVVLVAAPALGMMVRTRPASMYSSTDFGGMLRSRSARTARSRSFGASARARATSSSAVGTDCCGAAGRQRLDGAHAWSSRDDLPAPCARAGRRQIKRSKAQGSMSRRLCRRSPHAACVRHFSPCNEPSGEPTDDLLTIFAACSLAVAGLAAPAPAGAQNWPSRPITIVVPFPPGPLDVVARWVAPKLSEALGQPVVMDHGQARTARSARSAWRSRRRTARPSWPARSART